MGTSRTGQVRVRFAPSPTGYLHVGGARTALFNWLFARHSGGAFVLRIEDTDVERSTLASTDAIIESLTWLGLDWDEGPGKGGPFGPYVQSERVDTYVEHIERLLDQGNAYLCYCSPDELDEMRNAARARGQAPKYDGRCRDLTEVRRRELAAEGRKHVIRFRIPEGITCVKDLIRGDVRFENAMLDDFIIRKSDGLPTYNFAAVVDDFLMKITHVIRGEEHLPNTPRQVLVYEALGYAPPRFAHVPVILGPDRTKLSKRHGAMSVLEYRDMGYLPESLVNYLALLGWAYDASHEIFSPDDLIAKFSLERVSKNPAVFDSKKLEWMNGHYIREADPSRIFDLCMPYLMRLGLLKDIPEGADRERVERIVGLVRDRMKHLDQVAELSDFFFKREVSFDEEAVRDILAKPGVGPSLRRLKESLAKVDPFTADETEKVTRSVAEELGLRAGDLIHPARVALTGRRSSPGLFDVIALLGREVTCHRLEAGASVADSYGGCI